MHDLLQFMTFCTILFLNGLGIQLIFCPFFLNHIQDNFMEFRLCIFLFFTPLWTLFILVRLIYMVIITRIWQRFSNNFHLTHHSPQPLWEVAKPNLVSDLMFKQPPWDSSKTSVAKNASLWQSIWDPSGWKEISLS